VIVWQDVSTFHVKPYCWLPGMQEGSELDRATYGAMAETRVYYSDRAETDPCVIVQKVAELSGQNRIMSCLRPLAHQRSEKRT
jgi:hypothetical protein